VLSNKKIFKNITKPCWLIDDPTNIKYKFLKKITEICCILPKPIRKIVLSLIDKTGIYSNRLFSLINQFFLTVYIVEGEEKHTHKKMNILLINSEKPENYLSKILFDKKPACKRIGKINIFNIKRKINKISSDFDAVIVKCDRFYSGFFEKKGFTIIPEWVTMKLDTSDSLKNIYKKFNKSGKEDTRKVRKYGYTYELTEDIDELKMFYYKMYLPYAKLRYKDSAICANFNTIKHLFKRDNKLMLIKLEDEIVYGTLFSVNNSHITATYAGLNKEKLFLLKKGVSAAAYYFLIKWAKENKIKQINFGLCRSFLNDGGYCYKKKWGTKIDKTEGNCPGVFAFKACNNSKGIANFIDKNPFVYLEKNEIKTKGYT